MNICKRWCGEAEKEKKTCLGNGLARCHEFYVDCLKVSYENPANNRLMCDTVSAKVTNSLSYRLLLILHSSSWHNV